VQEPAIEAIPVVSAFLAPAGDAAETRKRETMKVIDVLRALEQHEIARLQIAVQERFEPADRQEGHDPVVIGPGPGPLTDSSHMTFARHDAGLLTC
jgi:hypothetical protein